MFTPRAYPVGRYLGHIPQNCREHRLPVACFNPLLLPVSAIAISIAHRRQWPACSKSRWNTTLTMPVTADELRQHASAENCWLLINGVVWEFTDFAAQHPGGASSRPAPATTMDDKS
jgi:hypothetical protein